MKATTAPPKAGAAVAASWESAMRSPALCSQAAVVPRSNVLAILPITLLASGFTMVL